MRCWILSLFVAGSFLNAEEFPGRSGKFIIQDAKLVQRKSMKLGTDLIGSFDITVTVRNETTENWSNVPIDIDVIEPDGTRVGSNVVPHTFRIDVALRAGEQKTVTINRARGIPRPVQVASFKVSLGSEVSQAVLLLPGAGAGFLASDIKCARDFEEAVKAGGLESRKRLAELIQYKCGVVFDAPVHATLRTRVSPYGQVTLLEGAAIGKVGWLPETWIK